MSKPLTVAVTGANGAMGRVVLPRLLASESVERVLALDLAAPELQDERVEFAPIDLTRPTADRDIVQALDGQRIDALVHLAFFSSQIRNGAYAHEVEALGTVHVLSACAEAKIRRLVMSGTTAVYGASPKNPNFLTEDAPLHGNPRSRFVSDKVEAEHQVRRFCQRHPGFEATILRFAPVLGPTVQNPMTRFLQRSVAPVVFGYDPLMQFVHEEDAAEAVLLALLAERTGAFNIVGRGVLPLSNSIRLAGGMPMPIPHPWARATLKTLSAAGILSTPPALLD
ncbi:MAG: NAD-dependent epimerase/dehydratase family protein, partial [Myxococcales bacterium]